MNNIEQYFSEQLKIWRYYLSLSIFAFLAIQLSKIFLPRLVKFLKAVICSQARYRQNEINRLTRELQTLHTQIKDINMTDQFALRSKCQRKINACDKELRKYTSSRDVDSVKSGFIIKVVMFIVQSIGVSYIISKAPTSHPFSERLINEEIVGEYNLPEFTLYIFNTLYYMPCWLISILVISFVGSIFTRFERKFIKKSPDDSLLAGLITLLTNSPGAMSFMPTMNTNNLMSQQVASQPQFSHEPLD